eukprot:Colp12_sorted_trinity150504_noHs@28894
MAGLEVTSTGKDAVHLVSNGNRRHRYIVTQCVVSKSQERGIWTQNTRGTILEGNTCIENARDGIDLDSFTCNAVVSQNTTSGNGRCGIFIEEGASRNVIMNNRCDKNDVGINIFANAAGVCEDNVLVGNNCISNTHYGIRIGSLKAPQASNSNVLFRNTTAQNGQVGLEIQPTTQHNAALHNSFQDSIRMRTANTEACVVVTE